MSQNKTIIALVIAIAAALVLLGITAGIYYGQTHPKQTLESVSTIESATTASTTEPQKTTVTTTTTMETTSITTTETTTETTIVTTTQKLPVISSAEIVAVGSEYYGGYNYKLNISGDFAYWFANASETNIGTDVRSFSFSSSDLTAQYPYFTAGSTFSDVRVTITPYNSDGIAGNPYTAVWNPNRIEYEKIAPIQSCNETGIIQTHGAIVPGYTTSYICEGGAMSMVRTSLGDGWHVQSSKCCYALNKLWYELYDAWDGDYYGWVSSEYLAWD